MQIFKCLQGVFIHCEPMGYITHRQGVNALELRQKKSQEMQGMHGAQRIRRVPLRQHLLKKMPDGPSRWKLAGERVSGLLQLQFRCWAELESTLGDQAKSAKKQLRINQVLRFLKKY